MNENNLIVGSILALTFFTLGYAIGTMHRRTVAYNEAWARMKHLEDKCNYLINKYQAKLVEDKCNYLINKYQAKLEEMMEKKR